VRNSLLWDHRNQLEIAARVFSCARLKLPTPEEACFKVVVGIGEHGVGTVAGANL
jgi:hypothetical protein